MTPFLIIILSYYGHTRYLLIKHTGGPVDNISNEPGELSFNIDTLIRHIVVCGAMFINHMYVDLFMSVTKIDSLCLNVLAWGLVSYDIFSNPSNLKLSIFNSSVGISTNSKLSLLTLAIFSLKFSWDGTKLKSHMF